jgi:hypothetical protein
MGICASSAVRDVLSADDAPRPVAKAALTAPVKAPAVRLASFPVADLNHYRLSRSVDISSNTALCDARSEHSPTERSAWALSRDIF